MKKSNINKIIIAIIFIILVALGITAVNVFTTTKKTVGDKTVTITIEDQVNHKTIMDKKTFQTNATTLKEFLKENKDALKVETTDEAPYGTLLLGLEGLKTTDMNKGPWWIYSFSSPSEKLDYKVGLAPAIDKINLGKQNYMTFVFTDSY
ncbi:hypothetical protein [Clostridium sp.]|uniref:hypothetical protein n=1 Tax=Clostridium sp. TaxID=1506 RepID=UPI003995FA06